MVVGRGGVEGGHGPSLHLEIWHFPIKCLAKKIVFLVSIRKNKISRFCPPYENYWLYMEKSIFQCPHAQFVWLIVGNWWTTLLRSGSTKDWSRGGSAFLLICTEVFLWLTHQKLEYPNIFGATCNFRNWGGNCPHCPSWLRACLCCRGCFERKFKYWSLWYKQRPPRTLWHHQSIKKRHMPTCCIQHWCHTPTALISSVNGKHVLW